MSVMVWLPWPPSLNRYYRTVQGRILISKEGRQYRKEVADTLFEHYRGRIPNLGTRRLEVSIVANPPDRRHRDLDNILKALLDALQSAKTFENDSQIDSLTISRKPPITGGTVWVEIRPIQEGH